MKKSSFIGLIVVLFICSFSGIYAEQNLTIRDQTATCISASKLILQTMASEEFNILRLNDTLRQAQILFDSQTILMNQRRDYDFSPIFDYCTEISNIREQALNARDEYSALLRFYEISVSEGMNTREIDFTIKEIENEISTERYEQVPALVEKAYEEISKARAEYTALNVFYSSTSRSLKNFMFKQGILWPLFQEKRWVDLSALTLLIIVLLIVYRTNIAIRIIRRKMEALEVRRNTIKELIMDVQKKYFQDGTLPEGEYNIKTKRFAEMIRDIDRQVPLLKEQMARFKYRDKQDNKKTKKNGK